MRTISNNEISRLKSSDLYIHREDFRLTYVMVCENEWSKQPKVLGSGTFGTVRLAYKAGKPEKKFAIKSIPREKVESTKTNLIDLEQELSILLSVDHPYIAKFYEAYLDNKYIHLVMEYCIGGDL